MPLKIYAEIYGCTANQADGEIALGILKSAGAVIVDNPAEADVNIILTCAVKKPTSDRMLERIKKLQSTGKPIVVCGCMVNVEEKNLKKIAPSAKLVSPSDITRIDEEVFGIFGLNVEHKIHRDRIKLGLPRVRRNEIVGIVPVSEGCRWRMCTFCVVPKARGNFFSYPLELIVEEVKRLLLDGCKEIWLTSQDMGSYGLDLGRNMLPDLIESVTSFNGTYFIRVGMMNPIYIRPILDRLISAYRNPKVFKFLHLPVQSGSLNVLKDMRRGYTPDLFKEIVRSFRESIKDISLVTDIIVGYPTETDEDFQMSLKLIEEIKPDYVNISKYFPRPGTPAEKLKTLPSSIVNNRSKIMTEISKEISLEVNLRWVGWEGIAIVDEIGKYGKMVCRNTSYKPIVLDTDENLIGRIVEVRVEDAGPYCLFGKLLRVMN